MTDDIFVPDLVETPPQESCQDANLKNLKLTKVRAPTFLKHEHKDKWLHELRHGGHRQTQGALIRWNDNSARVQDPHNPKVFSYCCLGLYCRFVAGIEPTWENEWGFNNESFVLPKAVTENTFGQLWSDAADNNRNPWIELTFGDELVVQSISLGELNDVGFTFVQIADVIEYFFDVEEEES